MSDLRELYQEVILDHTRRPRNFGSCAASTHEAEGYNPLCGDKVRVTLVVEDSTLREVRFEGSGCAISTASASLMTEALEGKTAEEASELFARFQSAVTGEEPVDPDVLGKLAVMGGVAEFPLRVKCATLAWHTLRSALEGSAEPATTE